MQTRRHSLIESCANVAIGFLVSLVATATVLPAAGVQTSLRQNVGITAAFTAISIVRSYLVRRWFNRLHSKP